MVLFFKGSDILYFALDCVNKPTDHDIQKLIWLFGDATYIEDSKLEGYFIGPRKEMITPWSTNAVEITQNMGISDIKRIEEFTKVAEKEANFDPMLQAFYQNIDQSIFKIDKEPDPMLLIDNIAAYNQSEGLALSDDEIAYLNELSLKLKRKLTDSEVFGFSQVNSEHCRHKIFNGTFIIDGQEMPESLFSLIKKTSRENPNRLISAYKDNVAFIGGPKIQQFAPENQDIPDYFKITEIDSVISLKAETHNAKLQRFS